MPLRVLELVRHFAADPRFEAHLFVTRDGPLAREARACGAAVHLLHFCRLRSPRTPLPFAAFVLTLPAALIRLARELVRLRIDCIHFADFIDHPFYPAARICGVRVVAHLRTTFKSAPARFWYRLWSKWCADVTICISAAVRASATPGAGTTELIYDPGPSPGLFDPDRTDPGPLLPPFNGVTITTIAKFLEVKGHDLLVTTARLVVDHARTPVRFVIVGDRAPGHEPFYAQVLKQIEQSGLRNQMIITGQVPYEQIPGLLRCTSIFVHLPRYHEGLGGVILEAMAMRCAVVAFDSGGCSECFEQGISGFAVPHLDCAQAAQTIIELCDNTSLRERVGAAARLHVRAHFGRDLFFERIGAIYFRLVYPAEAPV